MKKRHGFVSNSSSSSFVIDRRYVSQVQLEQIINHIEHSKTMPRQFPWEPLDDDDFFDWDNNPGDAWDIEITDKEIRGETLMDNFDMRSFLHKIGVPEAAINMI